MPNAGKSTLYNHLLGEALAIVNPKAQTTRHRIIGVKNGENYQIVYSDTPGILTKTSYGMHEKMMHFVNESVRDSDVLVLLLDIHGKEFSQDIKEKFHQAKAKKIICINKIDTSNQEELESALVQLKEEFEAKQAIYLAEMKKLNEDRIKENIKFFKEQEAKFAEQYKSMNNQERVVRVFQISRFNIFNSDCPNSLPKGASINPIYLTNNSQLVPSKIYLVCHNKNLVYTLAYGTLNFDPRDSYSLCLMVKGKMFLCDKETFAKCFSTQENKIPLKELDVTVNDAEDLKKAIGI